LDADIFAHIGLYVNDMCSPQMDYETRKIFPIALFRHAAKVLYMMYVPGEPQDWMIKDFQNNIADYTSRLLEVVRHNVAEQEEVAEDGVSFEPIR